MSKVEAERLVEEGEEEEEEVDLGDDSSSVYVGSRFNFHEHAKGVLRPCTGLTLLVLINAAQVLSLISINTELYNLDDKFMIKSTGTAGFFRLFEFGFHSANHLLKDGYLNILLRAISVVFLSITVVLEVRANVKAFVVFEHAKYNVKMEALTIHWYETAILFFNFCVFPIMIMITGSMNLYATDTKKIVLTSVKFAAILKLDNMLVQVLRYMMPGAMGKGATRISTRLLNEQYDSESTRSADSAVQPLFMSFAFAPLLLFLAAECADKTYAKVDQRNIDAYGFDMLAPATSLYMLAVGIVGLVTAGLADYFSDPDSKVDVVTRPTSVTSVLLGMSTLFCAVIVNPLAIAISGILTGLSCIVHLIAQLFIVYGEKEEEWSSTDYALVYCVMLQHVVIGGATLLLALTDMSMIALRGAPETEHTLESLIVKP
uniref:Uncharacterized protein n=1 Tax=Chromera velia CCMP2878 TaxID=1169474 RepID=A0A0G4HJ16_9ALVE|eukprot:Cvel_27987.t1-p1 / transcript=Cvel_27987.t1 / gene=Cvel_27987 / organism=Chromera_velia_CCMP2878 / gene_product=hypothetical protein / transcript_product=hypothetical protein / location=Cvel_scaffold3582:8550-12151(-) / protein_length=430 / sequence_SO=supercontig / SO=protein_coding / is_pseudo=false